MTMGKYWLGKTKPKKALSFTRSTFTKVAMKFKKKLMEFSTD